MNPRQASTPRQRLQPLKLISLRLVHLLRHHVNVMILFTPLSGVHTEGPLCYLLELDDFKILLDCGWNDTFDTSQFDLLKTYVNVTALTREVHLWHFC